MDDERSRVIDALREAHRQGKLGGVCESMRADGCGYDAEQIRVLLADLPVRMSEWSGWDNRPWGGDVCRRCGGADWYWWTDQRGRYRQCRPCKKRQKRGKRSRPSK